MIGVPPSEQQAAAAQCALVTATGPTRAYVKVLLWLLPRLDAAKKIGPITPCLVMLLLHPVLQAALPGWKRNAQQCSGCQCPCCGSLGALVLCRAQTCSQGRFCTTILAQKLQQQLSCLAECRGREHTALKTSRRGIVSSQVSNANSQGGVSRYIQTMDALTSILANVATSLSEEAERYAQLFTPNALFKQTGLMMKR